MNVCTPNRNYDGFLRVMFALRHSQLMGKTGNARREILDRWSATGRIQELREKLRRISENKPKDTIIYDSDGEGCVVIYADPLEFDGSKQEVLDYLYDECATRIYSEYDCTGEKFTRWFKVGHLGGNLWKVAEAFGLDV